MKKYLAKPKQTFWNLSAAKREKIELALVSEFAVHGYRKASVNSIAKRSGIAKGSLYQYFDNKEMIFLFVFDRFTELIKEMVGKPDHKQAGNATFWDIIRQVLAAGMTFIDTHPDYFQLYLNILFEEDVPHREELIQRVRLFSMEYFSPLIVRGQQEKGIRNDVPVDVIVFMIDAVLDRYLQGYARSYFDGGLRLAESDGGAQQKKIDAILMVLRQGLVGPAQEA